MVSASSVLSWSSSPTKFLYAWFGCGASTILIPLLVSGISRMTHSSNNDNNNNNNGNNNNNNNQDDFSTPWWFFGSSAGDEDRRDDDAAPPALVAAYLWSLIVFGGILFYGYRTLSINNLTKRRGNGDNSNELTNQELSSVVVALVMFANYALISAFLFGSVEGGVETDGRAVEEHGFVGQFGVLVYLTCLLWVVFSIGFALVFRRKARRECVTKVNVDYDEEQLGSYQLHNKEENVVS